MAVNKTLSKSQKTRRPRGGGETGAEFYVPYSGGKPLAVSINGHRLVIMSTQTSEDEERAVFEAAARELGADALERIGAGRTEVDQERVLTQIARSADAGVVIAPAQVSLSAVIENLRNQLPWVH